MSRCKSLALFITISLLISGSMGCQKSLKLADARTLEIGKSTEADLLTRFDKPDSTRETDKDGEVRKKLLWLRTDAQAIAVVAWVDYVRLEAELKEGKLVGWYFVSNAKSQRTSADLSRRSQIVKGKTSRSEILALMGEPHGRLLHGTILEDFKTADAPDVAELLIWFNAAPIEGIIPPRDTKVSSLAVGVDSNGTVVTVQLDVISFSF